VERLAGDEAIILKRAKAIAAEEGFSWELDFSVPSHERAPLRGQHFLSEDRRQEYLARARAEVCKEDGGS
jgi:hypothetical protein